MTREIITVTFMGKILFLLAQIALFTIIPVANATPALISLVELAGDSTWIILDCRPERLYNKEHLPSALSFSWESWTITDGDEVKYRILPPEKLAEKLGEMGISEQAKIVFYGDADTSWGGEGWGIWMLTWLGHKGPVGFLEGGIQGWQEAGLPTEKRTTNTREKVIYRIDLEPDVNISVKELLENRDQYVLVDVRSTLEWVKGHLPGAVHIPWKKFFQGSDHRPLEPAQFRKLLAEQGVTFEKPVVYYCTGGIRSGYAWLVHNLVGQGTAVNFEGGSEAWKKRGRPQ